MTTDARRSGKLIVVCGVDGAGKTTLLDGLAGALEARGFETVLTRQPTDEYRRNPYVREYLDTGHSRLSINTIALLAASDRMVHIETVIAPALAAGKTVLCDRYVYSTYAYFAQRHADIDFVRSANSKVRVPDAILLLEVDPQIAIARILARDGNQRKFEERDAAYLGEVQQRLAAEMPSHCLRLDAQLDREAILRRAVGYVSDALDSPHERVTEQHSKAAR